jgi:hypothetical protein
MLIICIAMCAALGATTHAHAAQAPAPRASQVLMIRANNAGVQNLGGFHPIRNPTTSAAVKAFGRPSSRQPRFGGDGCKVSWRRIGLQMTFAYYGGGRKRTACNSGVAKFASIEGPESDRWRTSRGLQVGDSREELERLHPSAVEWEGDYWLAIGYSPIGEGGSYPVLAATLRGETVRGFEVLMSPLYD